MKRLRVLISCMLMMTLTTRIFFKSMVSEIDPSISVVLVNNGLELLQYLNNVVPKSKLPCCIVLDINMPKRTGLEVLTEIKADIRFRPLPVVMLTVSDRDEDIIRSFEQGACSYIRKPVTFTRFIAVVKEFEMYWTLVSKIPALKR